MAVNRRIEESLPHHEPSSLAPGNRDRSYGRTNCLSNCSLPGKTGPVPGVASFLTREEAILGDGRAIRKGREGFRFHVPAPWKHGNGRVVGLDRFSRFPFWLTFELLLWKIFWNVLVPATIRDAVGENTWFGKDRGSLGRMGCCFVMSISVFCCKVS